jgi:hypothetical protein
MIKKKLEDNKIIIQIIFKNNVDKEVKKNKIRFN